jgi:hypothetical protein
MTRKVGPPGWREHMLMNRLDGFVGGPSHVPSALVSHIIAGTPSLRGRTEVEIIHARLKPRQMDYDSARKVRIARRRKFGLVTR